MMRDVNHHRVHNFPTYFPTHSCHAPLLYISVVLELHNEPVFCRPKSGTCGGSATVPVPIDD